MFDKIGLGVTVLALILNTVGVAIPYWFYFSVTKDGLTGTINFGLWKTCGEMPDEGSACRTFASLEDFSVPSEFNVTRALEIIAIIGTTAAVFVGCLKIFVKKEEFRLLYVAIVISGISGLLMIIGAIVFVVDNEVKTLIESDITIPGVDPKMKPHAGFALCVVSGILSEGAAALFFVATRWNVFP